MKFGSKIKHPFLDTSQHSSNHREVRLRNRSGAEKPHEACDAPFPSRKTTEKPYRFYPPAHSPSHASFVRRHRFAKRLSRRAFRQRPDARSLLQQPVPVAPRVVARRSMQQMLEFTGCLPSILQVRSFILVPRQTGPFDLARKRQNV
jgi:hypothetical protein